MNFNCLELLAPSRRAWWMGWYLTVGKSYEQTAQSPFFDCVELLPSWYLAEGCWVDIWHPDEETTQLSSDPPRPLQKLNQLCVCQLATSHYTIETQAAVTTKTRQVGRAANSTLWEKLSFGTGLLHLPAGWICTLEEFNLFVRVEFLDFHQVFG